MTTHIIVDIKLLDHAKNLSLPSYATEGSAGLDLRAAINSNISIAPLQRVLIPTGICLELPANTEAQIRSRSGLALNNGVVVLNSPGTIDSDYRGEIKVLLINLGESNFTIQRGDRIAQMVVSTYNRASFHIKTEIEETIRNDGGFGSTKIT